MSEQPNKDSNQLKPPQRNPKDRDKDKHHKSRFDRDGKALRNPKDQPHKQDKGNHDNNEEETDLPPLPLPIPHTADSELPLIGISIGDINGIGIEVILNTFRDNRMFDYCTPIIYGSARALSHHRKILHMEEFTYHSVNTVEEAKHGLVNVINCWKEEANISIGQYDKQNGVFAFKALEAAATDLQKGALAALVTAPVNKNQISSPENNFTGHTEYLTQKFNAAESLMLLISDKLKVGLVTNHVPVSDIAARLSPKLILQKLQIMRDALHKDFGIIKPKIAVLALNPHAGDEGLIGREDIDIIKPAIEKAQAANMLVFGPFAADGFFGSALYERFDAVLAMYHDQGLIPFKALSFGQGVNFTAGLPFVRTSPDHGTAYDIAGKGIASEESFRNAVFAAIDIIRYRQQYAEMNANPLQRGMAAAQGLIERAGDVV